MTVEDAPAEDGGLREVWAAYVVLGGCLALDELMMMIEQGAPLPPVERDLLTTAVAARRGRGAGQGQPVQP